MSTEVVKERVLSTLNADGSRRWLEPRAAPGRWLNRRRLVGFALIVLFVALPHVRIAEKPAVLLDIVHREFTFFGVTLYPTDTLLLALFMVSVFVAVFFLTAVFGRVWCGWACPQTVYLELVFRPIDRLLKRRGLMALKVPIYVVLALFLAHTFLSYFVGTDALRTWVTRSPLEHPISFLVIAGVTFAMLFDFGFFREQTCIIACPYGRMQSVLLDRDSLIVGYDRERGEPRGRLRRKALGDVALPQASDPGDCVDCTMCVQVCPTGIDIRDGLQMECVHCTQCIDACDAVMDRVGRERGLIRYASQRGLDEGTRRMLRPRVVLYPIVLAISVTAFVLVLSGRGSAGVQLLRGPGLPFTVQEDGLVSNLIRLKIRNRGGEAASYRVVSTTPGVVLDWRDAIDVRPGALETRSMLLRVPRSMFAGGTFEAALTITDGGAFEQTMTHQMMGPRQTGGGDD